MDSTARVESPHGKEFPDKLLPLFLSISLKYTHKYLRDRVTARMYSYAIHRRTGAQ